MKPVRLPGNSPPRKIQLPVRRCRRTLSVTPDSPVRVAGSIRISNAYSFYSRIARTIIPFPSPTSMRRAGSFTRSQCLRSTICKQYAMERNHGPDNGGSRRARVANFLSLERNVTISSAAILLIGFGEELWTKFLPKYLEALGASAPIVGLFGTGQDFFDTVYQYPGGWLSDRYGRRRAFLIFIALASVGYLVYLFSPSWPVVFVGLSLSLAWHSMASPAIFAVIGDSLPRERRAMGFTLQSILKRVPIVIAPIIGGALIASRGILKGVHTGLLITLALAAITVLLVLKLKVAVGPPETTNIRGVWRSFHSARKRLLISGIIIRTC